MSLPKETQDKIELVIRESLPSQVGETLRAELGKVQTLESKVKELENTLLNYKNMYEEQHKTLAKVSLLDNREAALVKREAEVLDKELKQDRDHALLRANEAERRSDDIFNLVSLIFKNPVVTKSVFESKNIVIPPVGGYTSIVSDNSTVTETVSK